MTYKSLFLLAATAMSAHCFAADESGKKLTWPVVAKEGAEHHFETQTLNSEEKNGKKKQISTESVTVIKHRADSKGGFVQTWSWRDSKSKYVGYDDAESKLVQELASAFGGVEIEVSLDNDGYYSRISNSAKIAEKMATMFGNGFDEGTKKAQKGQKESLTAEQKTQIDAIRKNMVTMMSSPVAVENLVGKTPQLFNFFAGGGLDPTTAFELDEEGANPFGGKPFPLKVHMELNLFEDDPGFVQATYISSLDKEKGVPILIEAVEKMLNEKFTDEDRKKFAGNVEVTHRADMRIRLSDGLIHFYRQIENKNVAGKKDENTIEMTLLETP